MKDNRGSGIVEILLVLAVLIIMLLLCRPLVIAVLRSIMYVPAY